jgi:NAD(P)-dependent dehydrogenase (short-subunit alcohol dehydrogenase family)
MSAAANRNLDLHFLQIDLQDLKSVKAAAMRFTVLEERLDILINNAGVRSRHQLIIDMHLLLATNHFFFDSLFRSCHALSP